MARMRSLYAQECAKSWCARRYPRAAWDNGVECLSRIGWLGLQFEQTGAAFDPMPRCQNGQTQLALAGEEGDWELVWSRGEVEVG